MTTAERAQAGAVSLRRVGRLFSPYRWQLVVVTVLIVASSIVAMASPFLLRAVIDDALPHGDTGLLVRLVAGMLAVAAATAALGVIQTWISTRIGQQVMHTLRSGVFAHLQRQSLAFFTRTRTGEVQSRITNDIGGMQSVVTSTATSVASNLTTAVATAVAMAALSWRLSLISLVVHAAGDLAHPQGRRRCGVRSPRSGSGSSPISTSPSTRACRSAECC